MVTAPQPLQTSFTAASANTPSEAPFGLFVQTRFTSTVPEVTQNAGVSWYATSMSVAVATLKPDWPGPVTEPPKSEIAVPLMLVRVTASDPEGCSVTSMETPSASVPATLLETFQSTVPGLAETVPFS